MSLQLHMALVPHLVSGIKHSSLISEEGELEPAGLGVVFCYIKKLQNRVCGLQLCLPI